MLQGSQKLTCVRAPHQDVPVRGAAEQVAAAGAEAAAVNPVAVTRERREGELREVGRVVNTEGFITGAGDQQRRREGAAADLVGVMSKSVE